MVSVWGSVVCVQVSVRQLERQEGVLGHHFPPYWGKPLPLTVLQLQAYRFLVVFPGALGGVPSEPVPQLLRKRIHLPFSPLWKKQVAGPLGQNLA